MPEEELRISMKSQGVFSITSYLWAETIQSLAGDLTCSISSTYQEIRKRALE